MDSELSQTVPGLKLDAARRVVEMLQDRLHATIDLQLTLKHVHWNVTGPTFVAVHEMLDPFTDAVRTMSDDVAERISTLGGVPVGTPGALVAGRRWDDYAVGRADARTHLPALDSAYSGVITDHRTALADLESLDPVTHDLVLGQVRELEKQQWFLRAHLGEGGAPTA